MKILLLLVSNMVAFAAMFYAGELCRNEQPGWGWFLTAGTIITICVSTSPKKTEPKPGTIGALRQYLEN